MGYKTELDPKEFGIFLTEEQIQERVSELGQQISLDYKDDTDTPLVLLVILNGGVYFSVDLSHAIDHPNIIMDYTGVSSYGAGMESSRNPVITLKHSIVLTGCNVILIDDIVDTGYSIAFLLALLAGEQPKSLKVCTLLSKPSRREVDVPIDYLGFMMEGDRWLQGYGLDTEGRKRELPYIEAKVTA